MAFRRPPRDAAIRNHYSLRSLQQRSESHQNSLTKVLTKSEQADEDTKQAKIIEVKQQDPVNVLLHSTEAGDPYYIGDMYDEQPLQIAQEWAVDTRETPYLLHIKSLSKSWPHLQYLADFMEVGTIPLRWKFLSGSEERCEREREERVERTKVARLDYYLDGKIGKVHFNTAQKLDNSLEAPSEVSDEETDKPQFQLFIVEDLSRRVIEALGSKFDIDPSFFREHVDDYAWYNVRDRFAEAPNLEIIAEKQDWFQVRWVRPRYFKTKDSFEKARIQSNNFNVLRRPDEDLNNGALLDDKKATVALTRTRASFWKGSADGVHVGVLLLDPTISEGFPMWGNQRNWEPPPSMHDKVYPSPPPATTLFDNVVHWSMKPYSPSPNPTKAPTSEEQSTDTEKSAIEPIIPIQPFLHIVCAEWLTMVSYISTRLSQLEWEISFPREFLLEAAADSSLEKLHTWRRLVPLYNEMLTETLARVFRFPPPDSSNARNIYPFHALQPSFQRALGQVSELQKRLDRLSTIATASITIADARASLKLSTSSYAENRNVSRLTWLATIFIPLTFITGLLSIQPDIPQLIPSFHYFFAIAIPLTVITFGITVITTWKGEWIADKVKRKAKKEKEKGTRQFTFYAQKIDGVNK